MGRINREQMMPFLIGYRTYIAAGLSVALGVTKLLAPDLLPEGVAANTNPVDLIMLGLTGAGLRAGIANK